MYPYLCYTYFLQMIKHQCPNHLHGSLVGGEGDSDSARDGAPSQRWRTEYLEQYCGRSGTAPPAGRAPASTSGGVFSSPKPVQAMPDDDDASVRSGSSRRSGSSSRSGGGGGGGAGSGGRLADSGEVTRPMHRPEPAVWPAAAAAVSCNGDSTRSLPGDQSSRGDSARSVEHAYRPAPHEGGEGEGGQGEEESSQGDSQGCLQAEDFQQFEDEAGSRGESRGEGYSSCMSGPLPVRFPSRFSTEYRDSFQAREPLEPAARYGACRAAPTLRSDAVGALVRPTAAPPAALTTPTPTPASASATTAKLEGSGRKQGQGQGQSLRGRTETQAKYAWPADSWYHQGGVPTALVQDAAPERARARAMSTGRLGMSRGHYQKTWWNDTQKTSENIPCTSQKSGFSADSLERGSGCLVAAGSPRIRVAPPLYDQSAPRAPAVRSPDSVSDLHAARPARHASPPPAHKTSHLLEKRPTGKTLSSDIYICIYRCMYVFIFCVVPIF
jgi:hypothetical protein